MGSGWSYEISGLHNRTSNPLLFAIIYSVLVLEVLFSKGGYVTVRKVRIILPIIGSR